MKSFDFYEFTGIITPGCIILAGLIFLYPELQIIGDLKNVTIGGLGIFVILAYAAGHLTQAIGNAIEWLWWKALGGMPTYWICNKKGSLLSELQIKSLEEGLPSKLGLKSTIALDKITNKEWFAITRQIYAAVSAHSRSGRIDTFNGNYGLNRGIASALLIISILSIIQNQCLWKISLIIFAGACIALYRMHRFAKHYARELFVQFLQLPNS